MFAGFLVPFRGASGDTLLVRSWWVIPPAMNLHRPLTDFARLLIIGALFVVVRNVIPVLMILD
jgi:hypothetical protein